MQMSSAIWPFGVVPLMTAAGWGAPGWTSEALTGTMLSAFSAGKYVTGMLRGKVPLGGSLGADEAAGLAVDVDAAGCGVGAGFGVEDCV